MRDSAEATGGNAAAIEARLADLRRTRAEEPEVLRARLDAAQAAANRLGPLLVEWIETPDWGSSESYLREHADELLTEDGETALQVLQLANRDVEAIAMHVRLLHVCLGQGVDAAYARLRQELAGSARASGASTGQPAVPGRS